LPEALPQLLWKINLKGEVLYSNSKYQNYIGTSKNTKGSIFFSPKIIHAEDLQKSLDAFKDGVKNKTEFNVEIRLRGVDGKYKWFTTIGSPIIDDEGTLTCFYGTCSDNTEYYEMEREKKILPDSLPLMVWKVDLDGDVIYANQKFKSYVGAVEGQQLNVFSDKVFLRYLNYSGRSQG
jgi:PAS domain S-box-containing protein